MYVYHYPLPCMSLTCILDPNHYVCKYNITWLILPTKLLHYVSIDTNGRVLDLFWNDIKSRQFSLLIGWGHIIRMERGSKIVVSYTFDIVSFCHKHSLSRDGIIAYILLPYKFGFVRRHMQYVCLFRIRFYLPYHIKYMSVSVTD